MTDDHNREDNLSQAWKRRLERDENKPDPALSGGDDATRQWDPKETQQWDPHATPEPQSAIDTAGAPETAVAPRRTSYHEDEDGPSSAERTAVIDTANDAEETDVVAPSFAPAKEGLSDDNLDDGEEGTVAKKKRRWPLVTFGALVLLAAGYVGANYYLGDRVPADTKIAGIDVGGMTRSEAQNALATGLQGPVTTPRDIEIESGSTPLDPASIDLDIDYDATLDPLFGFTLNPHRILAEFSGGKNLDATVKVNSDKLDAVMKHTAEKINSTPVDAKLAIEHGQAVITPDKPGYGIEIDTASEAVVDAWLTTTGPIKLPETTLEAEVTAAELEAYATDTIEPILSGPASINVKDSLVEISADDLGGVLTVNSEEGAPELAVDQAKLEKLMAPHTEDILAKGKDARIEIIDHKTPKIHPSTDGEAIDVEALSTSILALGSNRTIDAVVTTEPAEFSTEDAEKMGIKEVVSEITTPLTSDNVRTTNLVVGTSTITNTLVKPGEQFNLGEALGPVDAEHGYVASGVVANGFNSTAMGGGLSQLSTNTFNIGYRAGMIDVSHQPHSKYFDRYPMGLEATLWGDTIPMIWENNTPYGALVETWVADGQVHTRLWSTKYWDVEVFQGEPFGHTSPTTRTNTAHDCVPSGAGASGFSVTVGRTVSREGKVHEEDEYTWTYQPVDAVRCG